MFTDSSKEKVKAEGYFAYSSGNQTRQFKAKEVDQYFGNNSHYA